MRNAIAAALGATAMVVLLGGSALSARAARTTPPFGHGSIIEHDSLVAARQPGPHRGTGQTTAYSFFAKAPELTMVFRKRALHPGASIGQHLQKEDEIYYVLAGRGELTLDDERREVGPGTAILTRPGSTHSIRQIGADDLVLLIAYEKKPTPAANK